MRTPNTTDILNAIQLAEIELILAKGMRDKETTLSHLDNAEAQIRKAKTELLRDETPEPEGDYSHWNEEAEIVRRAENPEIAGSDYPDFDDDPPF